MAASDVEEIRLGAELAGELVDTAGRALAGIARAEDDEARRRLVLALRATLIEARAVLTALYGPDGPRRPQPTATLLQRAASAVLDAARELS